MANNCFKKVLKVATHNNLLPELDELVIDVSQLNGISNKNELILQLATYNTRSYQIDVVGDGYFVKDAYANLNDPSKRLTTATIEGTNSLQNFYFLNGNYHIKIKGKGILTMFRLQKFGTSLLSTVFNIDLLNLSGMAYLTTLDLCRQNILGDISNVLFSSSSMTSLSLIDSKVTGSIEGIADSMYNFGRTTGSLAVTCNGVVTCDGSPVESGTTKTITFASDGYTIS